MKNTPLLISGLALIAITDAAIFIGMSQSDAFQSAKSESNNTSEQIVQISQEDRDFSVIDQADIEQGCVAGRDCIPSIENPEFESVESASEWVLDDTLMFGVEINGEVRGLSTADTKLASNCG